MQKINFEAGSEEKFIKFIKNISDKDKTALISHIDLDGIASAKVAESVIKHNLLKLVNYEEVNERLTKELRDKKINKVIFIDISITNPAIVEGIEKFAEILIIDHHVFEKELNSDKTTFINAKEYCAAYLSYVLFSKIKNIENLDWLVACACVADVAYKNIPTFMKKIYEKYSLNEIKIRPFVKKLAYTLIYFEDNLKRAYDLINNKISCVEKLEKYSKEVEKEVVNLINNFEKEKNVYGKNEDIYFWEFETKFHIKPIVSTILSFKNPDKTFIFISSRDEGYSISARRQDKKVDLPKLLKKLLKGFEDSSSGGHIPAAGGYFLKKDLPEFRKRLEEIA